MAFTPRECFIKKCDDFKGFGFTLHAEIENGKCKGFINKIDEGSPAEHLGLLVGDRLVEVNGVNVENDTYQHIIEKIIASGDKVRLLVVDSETDDYYTGLGMTVTAPRSGAQHQDSDPNDPAPAYEDAIKQQYSDDTRQSNNNVTQQSERSGATNNDHYPSRHIQAPISHSRPEATRQISASSSRYRTYGSYTARNCAARGDMVGAHAAAESARKWTQISIAVGVVSFVILGVCIGVLRGLYPQVTYHR